MIKNNNETRVENGVIYMSLNLICDKYFNNSEGKVINILKTLSNIGLIKIRITEGLVYIKVSKKMRDVLDKHFIEISDDMNFIYFDEYAAKVIVDIYKSYSLKMGIMGDDDIIERSVAYVDYREGKDSQLKKKYERYFNEGIENKLRDNVNIK